MLGAMPLLRPSELARAWELHPKTVVLWIREGRLPAIRTPGAQYRVRADDARAYCEKNGLPMPRKVARPGGSVLAIGRPQAVLRALAKACKERGATFVAWPNTLEGLLAVAAEVPDVLAIDAGCADVKLADALRALRRTLGSRTLPVVVFGAATRGALGRLGVASVIERGQVDGAVTAVFELLERGAST